MLTKLKNKNEVAIEKLNELTGTAAKQVNEKCQYRLQCLEIEAKVKNLKLTTVKADKITKAAAKDISGVHQHRYRHQHRRRYEPNGTGIGHCKRPTFSTPTEDHNRGPKSWKIERSRTLTRTK